MPVDRDASQPRRCPAPADYRGYFAGVIARDVILGATLPDRNERGKAMLAATFTRFMTAIDDLDFLALLPAL